MLLLTLLPSQARLGCHRTLQVQPARMSQHHLLALGSQPPFSDTTTPSSFVTSVSWSCSQKSPRNHPELSFLPNSSAHSSPSTTLCTEPSPNQYFHEPHNEQLTPAVFVMPDSSPCCFPGQVLLPSRFCCPASVLPCFRTVLSFHQLHLAESF